MSSIRNIEWDHGDMDVDAHWAQIDRTGGPDACWPWTGDRFLNSGYGNAQGPKRPMCAHRLTWHLANGSLPTYVADDGREASYRMVQTCPGWDGRAVNKVCCNPAHITLMTVDEDLAHRATHDR